jgi:hypothetical protein
MALDGSVAALERRPFDGVDAPCSTTHSRPTVTTCDWAVWQRNPLYTAVAAAKIVVLAAAESLGLECASSEHLAPEGVFKCCPLMVGQGIEENDGAGAGFLPDQSDLMDLAGADEGASR